LRVARAFTHVARDGPQEHKHQEHIFLVHSAVFRPSLRRGLGQRLSL
jgi:hypothetical protein